MADALCTAPTGAPPGAPAGAPAGTPAGAPAGTPADTPAGAPAGAPAGSAGTPAVAPLRTSSGTARRILALAAPESRLLAFGGVALLLDSLADLLVPRFFGGLIDSVAVRDGAQLRSQTVRLVVLLSGGAALAFARSLAFGIGGERVVARLRAQLFSRMLAQDAAFFDGAKSGELISRLTSDCTKLQDAATQNVSALLSSLVVCLTAVALMFATQWRLTLVTLAVVPPMVVGAIVYGRAIGKLSKTYQDRLSTASGIAAESLGSVKTVRAFAGEPLQLAAYLRAVGEPDGEGLVRLLPRAARVGLANLSAYGLGVVRSAWLALFVSGLTLAFFLAIVAILYYGCLLVLRGVCTLGELVSFVLYALQIGGAMANIAANFSAFTEAVGASTRVFELIDRVPEMASILDGPIPPSAGGAPAAPAAAVGAPAEADGAGEALRVQFIHVSFAYSSSPSQLVLDRFDLAVPTGTTAALVGPSGAGKSTVAALLLRLYAPTSGRVLLGGCDLATVDVRALRRLVGVVSQEPVLFACSILENIAYGARAHAAADAATAAAASPAASGGGGAAVAAARTAAAAARAAVADASLRARVEEAAARAHCTEFLRNLPDGLETAVGERGVRLSGGQKQRVAIARALLENPPLLILDEATSALDAESEALVVAALDALTVGRTTLVIAHRYARHLRAGAPKRGRLCAPRCLVR
jgi:ATP-binding cassette subfamily B protein